MAALQAVCLTRDHLQGEHTFMGELRLRQPQSRVVPFFDGPVTRRYLTRKQTRGLTEVGALAPSEREGEPEYYTDFTSALQAENLIFSAW